MTNEDVRLASILKRYDERKYVVTHMGCDYTFAHTDISYLLNLVGVQQQRLDTAVKALGQIEKGDDSYHTELSEAKEWIEKVENIAMEAIYQVRRGIDT